MYMYIHMCVCVYVRTYKYAYVYMYTYLYTYRARVGERDKCIYVGRVHPSGSPVAATFFFGISFIAYNSHHESCAQSKKNAPRRQCVARRPEVISREKTRPPPVSGASSRCHISKQEILVSLLFKGALCA